MSMMLSRIFLPTTCPRCLASTEVPGAIESGQMNSSEMSFELLWFKLRGRSEEGERTTVMGSFGRLPLGRTTMSDSRKSLGRGLPARIPV
eukprot:16451453-Heterocapsa_arctica.AAC.1